MKKYIEAFKKNLDKEDIITLFQRGIDEDEFHENIDELSDELGKTFPLGKNQNQQINAIGSSKFIKFVQTHEINKEKKNLLCVDDFEGNKNVGEIASNHFNNLRKYNVNMIYIGHVGEMLKAAGKKGIKRLTELCNQVVREGAIPREWELSTLIPIFKDKDDPMECGSYRAVKLLEHGMKVLEGFWKRD